VWNFIIIFLFSKTLLLTPNFIDINKGDKYLLKLKENIRAITTGATIQIDVSEMILTGGQKMGLLEARRAVSDMFSMASIDAVLISEKKKIILTYQGGIIVNNDSVRLVLCGSEDPTGLDFSDIVIKTDIKLERVKIYWKNYKK